MGSNPMSGLFTEAGSAKSNLAATLAAGVEQISAAQTVVFTKYVKCILPLDGYVFWLNSAIVGTPSGGLNLYGLPLFIGASALPGQATFNSVTPNQPYTGGPAITVTSTGSLHVSIDRRQDEEGTIDVNRVTFTALAPVPELDTIDENTLWIGSFTAGDGSEGTIRFAFSARANYYQQADLWHYTGDAIYPDMESQIIDTVGQFDTLNVVVSNSLPLWLSMDQMHPPFPFPARQNFPLFPSFLVPPNVIPPYGVVHIEPGQTTPIMSAPAFGQTYSQVQLVRERVRVTIYGTRNFNALDFVEYVQFMAEQPAQAFGIMNSPVVQDQKSTQRELAVIAMKKTVEFEINYYQARMRNIARQLIKKVVPQYFIGD